MARSKKLTKEEESIKYIWIQVERWLKVRYKKNILLTNVESAPLAKNYGLFSKVFNKGKEYMLVVDRGMLKEGKKNELLDIVGRTAIEIYFNSIGKEFNDLNEVTQEELKKYGLPIYGKYPQVGLRLRQYSCSKCDRLVALRTRKIPKSKEFEYNPNNLTSCCKAVIKDDGWVDYSNAELQRVGSVLENIGRI